MKSLPLFFLLLFHLTSTSQNTEFKQYENGLMYDASTMKQLKFIVDSLNIKYRTCELDKVYYSSYQTKAHFISLEKENIAPAIKDINNNMSYEDFIKKYPSTETDTSLVVLKRKYNTYDKRVIVEFKSMLKEREIVIRNDSSKFDQPVKGKWVSDNRKDSDYRKQSIQAFYFPAEFEKQPLPEKYARMIQYSDCMVDTTTQIFTTDAKQGRFQPLGNNKVAEFMEVVHKKTNMPIFDYVSDGEDDEKWETEYEKFHIKDSIWHSTRFKIIEDALANDKSFVNLMNEAVQEALETKTSNDEFEDYVEHFYSPSTALALKRNRIVIGSCSQDDSPRLHALNIARLSAKSINWETFLRAHLNIMNDRFERMSDGSYAQNARKTYIQELEELEIDVENLLLGISLRIDNPSDNHYYGSINRLGRALSETKNPQTIETKMLDMIADNQLDDYNRIIIYYLFKNYNHYLKDETKKEENAKILKSTIDKVPSQLFASIEKEK